MKRREFVTLFGGAFAVGLAPRPFTTFAQTSAKRRLVACLVGGTEATTERYFGGFLQGMRELGYVEGGDYGFEVRYAEGDQARSPLLAEELVRLKPDVIVSGTMAGIIAVKKLTDAIPIVSQTLVDPVAFGWAASHARPGGNVTGVLLTVENLPSKLLALAVEMVPGMNKIGLLVNPGNPAHPFLRPGLDIAARALGVELVVLEVRSRDDLHAAFQSFARESTKIVLALPDAMFLNERKRISLFAMAARLPTMFGFRENVVDGGLMSYGIDLRESWRRAAAFVDKILKGANPGDLPIEFPTKLELVINLTAAKALGLDVPATLLARADEVIE
jgi:putative tryptophan/tyrosine transport system substrate-binding protein